MSEIIEKEISEAKKGALNINKKNPEAACQSLLRGVNDMMGYAKEGINPKWSTHRAEVLYKAYLSFDKPEITIFEDFFREQKKKLKPRTRTI